MHRFGFAAFFIGVGILLASMLDGMGLASSITPSALWLLPWAVLAVVRNPFARNKGFDMKLSIRPVRADQPEPDKMCRAGRAGWESALDDNYREPWLQERLSKFVTVSTGTAEWYATRQPAAMPAPRRVWKYVEQSEIAKSPRILT